MSYLLFLVTYIGFILAISQLALKDISINQSKKNPCFHASLIIMVYKKPDHEIDYLLLLSCLYLERGVNLSSHWQQLNHSTQTFLCSVQSHQLHCLHSHSSLMLYNRHVTLLHICIGKIIMLNIVPIVTNYIWKSFFFSCSMWNVVFLYSDIQPLLYFIQIRFYSWFEMLLNKSEFQEIPGPEHYEHGHHMS